MKKLCEMSIQNFFELSSGCTAIIGKIIPDVEFFIPNNSSADLYVSGRKIKTINIVGEDRFSGVDEIKLKGNRSLRTNTNISEELTDLRDAKLVIFENS